MIKTIVARHDRINECFPDIARAADGTLVCIYRECMGHAPFPFSRLVVRRSGDDGMNWTERQILIECVARPEWVDACRRHRRRVRPHHPTHPRMVAVGVNRRHLR